MKDLTATRLRFTIKVAWENYLFTLSKIFTRQLGYQLLSRPKNMSENQINLNGNTKLEMASFLLNCQNVLQSPICSYGKIRHASQKCFRKNHPFAVRVQDSDLFATPPLMFQADLPNITQAEKSVLLRVQEYSYCILFLRRDNTGYPGKVIKNNRR